MRPGAQALREGVGDIAEELGAKEGGKALEAVSDPSQPATH
ncbi:hypothetical protein [Corallococcus sicarius]|nr:hypothetical protein [Corallococcus sicarius]